MRRRAIFVVAVSLGTSGCFEPKRQLVLPPVPMAAKPAPPQPEFEDPPEINTPLPPIGIAAVTLSVSPEIETPPPKPTQKRKPTAPAATTTTPNPTVPTPETEPQPPPQPPTPVAPQLSEILTDDRRKQYDAELTSSVARATAVLRRASSHRLTPQQTKTVERIVTFLQQAEESKSKDLVTAWQLAHRADLLGQDLLNSLQ